MICDGVGGVDGGGGMLNDDIDADVCTNGLKVTVFLPMRVYSALMISCMVFQFRAEPPVDIDAR